MLIDLSAKELFDVRAALLPALEPNEQSALGYIRLTAEAGGRRRWQATDSVIGSILLGGRSAHDVDVLISPRLLPAEVMEHDKPVLEIPERDGVLLDQPMKLHLDGFAIAQPGRLMNWPDLEELTATAQGNEQVATAVFDRHVALRAMRRLILRPAGADPDLNPPAYLDVHASTVRIRADWPGWGRSEVQIAAETSGRASMPIAPRQLSDILACASETVALRLPVTAGEPIAFAAPDGSWLGMLMGVTVFPSVERITGWVQQLLEHHFGLPGIDCDADGDLPIPFEKHVVYARAVGGEPPAVQVFAVVAVVDEPDAALYQRLNDLNAVIRDTRLFWADGQVLCETDIGWNPDAVELRNALRTVTDATKMIRGLFAEDTHDH